MMSSFWSPEKNKSLTMGNGDRGNQGHSIMWLFFVD